MLFQQKNGLTVDGIAGMQTLRAMGISSTTSSSDKVTSIPIKYGARGNDVKTVQSKLKNWGYYDGAVDGIFGSRTKEAVKYFQRKKKYFLYQRKYTKELKKY